MTQTPHYPTNAGELLASGTQRHPIDFAIIATITEIDGKMVVAIDNDAPIAACNTQTQQAVKEQSGVELPLRKDINSGDHQLEPDQVILGAGAFLELQKGEERIMPLLKRDAGAPSNPNTWTNPSGICGADPLQTIRNELVEETGLIRLAQDRQSLEVLVPVSVEHINKHINNSNLVREGLLVKEKQESIIRDRLPDEFENLPITYKALPLKPLAVPENTPIVEIRIDGKSIPAPNLMLSFDEKHQGATLSARYEAQLDTQLEHMLIDPESFNREAAFVTREALQELPCTKALEDAKAQLLGTSQSIRVDTKPQSQMAR